MTFHEKSTWAEALTVAAVYAWYAVTVLGRLATTPAAEVDYRGPLLVAAAALVVLVVAGQITVAVLGWRGVSTDERDRAIRRRGAAASAVVLGATAVVGVALTTLGTEPLWVVGALVTGLVVAVLTSAATRIAAYRRGTRVRAVVAA